MKKVLILALLALVPTLQANWFADDNHKEFTVRATAVVIGLYGLRTMVAFKKGALIRNIFRIPVGGALAAAGGAGAFFAPEIVTHYDRLHDQVMLDYYDEKYSNNRAEYSPADALEHTKLKFKNSMRLSDKNN